MAPDSTSEIVVGGALGHLAPRVVRRAVEHVLRGEQRSAAVAVTFLGARRMQAMNLHYKSHDEPTDVLSFPLPLPDGTLTGDVYICRLAAAREAHQRSLPVREELIRLVVHGTLHILGYDHPEDATRTASPMWRRQERYVRELS
ncbi:MAG: rRNA maturation RNase YbeY [Gemmatimonadota bacterium]